MAGRGWVSPLLLKPACRQGRERVGCKAPWGPRPFTGRKAPWGPRPFTGRKAPRRAAWDVKAKRSRSVAATRLYAEGAAPLFEGEVIRALHVRTNPRTLDNASYL